MLHPSRYIDSLEKIRATSEVLRMYQYSDETLFLKMLSNYQQIWNSTHDIIEYLSREDYWSPELNLHIKTFMLILRDMTVVSNLTLIERYRKLSTQDKLSYRTFFGNMMCILSNSIKCLADIGLFEIKNLMNKEADFIQPKTNIIHQSSPTLH